MYIRGKQATLLFLKDSEYVPFRCTTDCALTINTETKQVRTIGDGRWAKSRGQRQSYVVTLTGLIQLQATSPVTFWLIENYVMQMLPVDFRLIYEDSDGIIKIITGSALIKTATVTGVPVGFATGAFEMEGIGAPIITDSASVCSATIGAINYTAGENPGEIVISYEDVNVFDGGRLEYSVDGGDRLPIFDPGTSGDFTITGLTEGDHTVIVYAVCITGADGESNEITFHVDEGGDPGVGCSLPGDIGYGPITGTTADVSWVAASPVPGDGYYWELVNYGTLEVVQTGSTVTTSVSLTGLTAGITYLFKVRSICETGVSQSAFRSDFFSTPDACNVPGAPSISSITSSTATASWSAPTPAPGDGYEWELLFGVTVIDSGTTTALFVNLTGLTPSTDYSFRVKSICVVGVSESGFNTAFFSSGAVTNNIDWDFTKLVDSGTFEIFINGVSVVLRSASDLGSFSFLAGDDLSVELDGIDSQTYQLDVVDLTTSTTVYSNTDTAGFTMPTEALTDTHNYSISATIDAI